MYLLENIRSIMRPPFRDGTLNRVRNRKNSFPAGDLQLTLRNATSQPEYILKYYE